MNWHSASLGWRFCLTLYAISVGGFEPQSQLSVLVYSTGKLGFDPDIWKKQADTFRICLGALSDYCPESPKKSGGGFSQNGGIRESMLVSFFKCRWRSNGSTYRLHFYSKMSVFQFSLLPYAQEANQLQFKIQYKLRITKIIYFFL